MQTLSRIFIKNIFKSHDCKILKIFPSISIMLKIFFIFLQHLMILHHKKESFGPFISLYYSSFDNKKKFVAYSTRLMLQTPSILCYKFCSHYNIVSLDENVLYVWIFFTKAKFMCNMPHCSFATAHTEYSFTVVDDSRKKEKGLKVQSW